MRRLQGSERWGGLGGGGGWRPVLRSRQCWKRSLPSKGRKEARWTSRRRLFVEPAQGPLLMETDTKQGWLVSAALRLWPRSAAAACFPGQLSSSEMWARGRPTHRSARGRGLASCVAQADLPSRLPPPRLIPILGSSSPVLQRPWTSGRRSPRGAPGGEEGVERGLLLGTLPESKWPAGLRPRSTGQGAAAGAGGDRHRPAVPILVQSTGLWFLPWVSSGCSQEASAASGVQEDPTPRPEETFFF